MNVRALLIDEVNNMPDNVVEEVLDFARFVKQKVSRENIETAIASESSLKKDWDLPEENEAWKDL